MQSIAKHYRSGNPSFETVTVTNRFYKSYIYSITVNSEEFYSSMKTARDHIISMLRHYKYTLQHVFRCFFVSQVACAY